MRFRSTFIDSEEEFDADDWKDALEQALGHEWGPNDLKRLEVLR